MSERPPESPAPARAIVPTGFLGFFLLGWTVLLVPSLVRDIEREFAVSDAGMGLAYLLYNACYVVGTVVSGIIAERFGRRRVLPAGPGLVAAGLGLCAVAAGWPVFVGGFLAVGLGAGITDAGINGVFLDLYPDHRRAAALNRLHLFVAIGAVAGPLAVGHLVSAGVAWRVLVLASALAMAPVGVLLAALPMPHGRAGRLEAGRIATTPEVAAGRRRRPLPLPLIALSLAMGCYIATEMGITSWLVRYLADAPLDVATLALALFWAGLAASRLVLSLVAGRVPTVRFAAMSAAACGLAVVAAVAVPWLPVRIAAFAAAGFGAGPVYPMIMAIGGSLYPGRTSFVSGVLAGAAVTGSVVYPPLMGFVSATAGLGVGMLGAGAFGFVTAAGILVAARFARPAPASRDF
jgi:fucose permease